MVIIIIIIYTCIYLVHDVENSSVKCYNHMETVDKIMRAPGVFLELGRRTIFFRELGSTDY